MLKDCQFCSVISKANGEDPIGTAGTCDHWLLIEAPQPWSAERWQKDPVVSRIVALIETLIRQQGMKLRPLAIAPDKTYSQSGYTRVFYYRRPAHCFSHYEKQEYLVPTEQGYDLLVALLQAPERLNEFAAYQQNAVTRDLLVCTHGDVDVACARFGNPIYNKLRKEYAGQAYLTTQLRVWRCSHFGGHRFAPTLIDLPTGQYFGHLEMFHLDSLVYRQGDWSQLRLGYRGWAGLSQFEQMAEREIWMQLGWSWLDYAKVGQTLAQDPAESPTWASVQIEFQPPEGAGGIYKAAIELIGEVETGGDSGVDMELYRVKQYHVSHLTQLPLNADAA